MSHYSDFAREVNEICREPYHPILDRWPRFDLMGLNDEVGTSDSCPAYNTRMDIVMAPSTESSAQIQPASAWGSLLRLTNVMSDLLSVKYRG